MTQKILICGDSFAADQTPQMCDHPGWPNLLAQKYRVANVAQAGCSEYKILKQLQNHAHDQIDLLIVVHTSPFRIPVEKHPLYDETSRHRHSDFIYSDTKSSSDPRVSCVSEYFEKYFWREHALFVHKCTLQEQQKIIGNQPCLHIAFCQWDHLVAFENFLELSYVFKKHRGTVNHLSKVGNECVFKEISEYLECI